MKAKFNEEKNTLKVNGKKFNVISAKSELKAGDFKNGEWVNNKRYVTFEIEEMEDVKQPQRKFKAGDDVRIKEGISSETHNRVFPGFTSGMDKFIGMNLTVAGYTEAGNVFFNEDEMEYIFDEDWLEPWSDEKEELKEGDMAIFWDRNPCYAAVRVFGRKGDYCYIDEGGTPWKNAVKFECTKGQKEFLNKVRKGEITL